MFMVFMLNESVRNAVHGRAFDHMAIACNVKKANPGLTASTSSTQIKAGIGNHMSFLTQVLDN